MDDWRFIGDGPASEVWEATQADFHRAVAVKVFGGDEESRYVARRRAAAMGRLSNCAGSLPVLRVVELADERTAVITPLMRGSLRDRWAEFDDIGEDTWVQWLTEACAGLDEIHRNSQVHGNIHAGNVMVSRSGAIVLADAEDLYDAAVPGSGREEDLRALTGAFLERTPGASVGIERLRTLLGTRGEHLADRGVNTADDLADFVARELKRPVAQVASATPAASSSPETTSKRRWLIRSLIVFSLVIATSILVITLSNVTGGSSRENGGDGVAGVDDDLGDEGAGAQQSVPVTGAASDISVADGQACSLLSNGEAACWGMNLILPTNRQVSESYDPDFDRIPFPLEGGPFDAVEIGSDGTGNEVLCAASGGSVSCRGWGIASGPADIPEEDLNRSDLLYPIPRVNTAVDVTVAAAHACALLEDRTVYCWGSNTLGQLGNGERADAYAAGPVKGLSDVDLISAGAMTTCAIKADGSVWCWGATRPPLGSSATPEQVAGLPAVAQVSAGTSIICAVDLQGRLWCWGDFEAVFGVRNADFWLCCRFRGLLS